MEVFGNFQFGIKENNQSIAFANPIEENSNELIRRFENLLIETEVIVEDEFYLFTEEAKSI
jgi:hypothetical protein